MTDEIAAIQPQPTLAPTIDPQSSMGSKFNTRHLLLNNRRPLLLVASSLMLMGFIGLVLWSADPPYRPVFGSMSEKEAATVVEALQKEHISYRLESGGTVLVPADQVYAVRLKLAGQDITPHSGTGFEIFDKSSEFGISNFAQKVNYQRALQGELARTIEVLPRVSAVRVHIVLAKDSAFVEREQHASASVMLQTSGQRLPKQAVLAIQNLVSASVPNLERKAVIVVDSSGNLLSSDDEEASMGAGQSQQEYKTQIERRLETRLTGMLEQVVGTGQAVVRVAADIVREHIEQNSQRYNPDEAVLRSQNVIKESKRMADATVLGVPGMASNDPTKKVAPPKPTTPSEEANRTEETNNYEISSTTEQRIIPFGAVKKLSVAVIVGDTSKDENGTSAFIPRSQQELKRLRALVERAMGYDEDRGDTLDVQSMPLVDISSSEDNEALTAIENKAFYMQMARYGLVGLALFLLAWFLLRPLTKRLTSQHAITARIADERANPALPAPALANLEHQSAARKLAAENPAQAAHVLHQWVQKS